VKNIRLLAFAVGAIALVAACWLAIASKHAQAWPTIEGHIESRYVSTYGAGGDVTAGSRNIYVPEVRYSYVVDEHKYIGQRIFLWDTQYNVPSIALKQFGKIKNGDVVAVHYDPTNPSSAVLDTQLPSAPFALSVLAGVVFVALSFWLPTFAQLFISSSNK
jgi:hypothetical protein